MHMITQILLDKQLFQSPLFLYYDIYLKPSFMQPGSDFKYFERFLSPPLRVKDNFTGYNRFDRNCTTELCYGNRFV